MMYPESQPMKVPVITSAMPRMMVSYMGVPDPVTTELRAFSQAQSRGSSPSSSGWKPLRSWASTRSSSNV